MPVPAKKDYTYGTIEEQGFDSLPHVTGCRDRPNRNFTTAVAEGKTRGHVRSKTPASRAVRMLFNCIKPCFASLYRGIQMCEISIKPRPFGSFVS
jgi:hypothetical protein